jgi:hypothetical protein
MKSDTIQKLSVAKNYIKKRSVEENSIKENSIIKVYNEIYSIIGSDEKLTSMNIINIVLSLMQFIEGFKDVSGPLKKEIITQALDRYIKATMGDSKEAAAIRLVIDNVLPSVIDSFIKLDKKEIKIKIKKCVSKLLCC